MMPTVDRAVRTPKQDRSRATLERILSTTEGLLQSRLLEEITLADVLEASGISVGAFYARFASKEALVPALYARYDARLTARAREVLDPERWRGKSLAHRALALFRYSVRGYRANRGLMRALALRARTHPEGITTDQRAHRGAFYALATELFLQCRDEIRHPEPEAAVQFGLLMALATFREKILYDRAPHPQAVIIHDRQLAVEAARAFLGYLQADWRKP